MKIIRICPVLTKQKLTNIDQKCQNVKLHLQAAHLRGCACELLEWTDFPRGGRERPEDHDALCVRWRSDVDGQRWKEEELHTQQKEIQRWPVAHGSYVGQTCF